MTDLIWPPDYHAEGLRREQLYVAYVSICKLDSIDAARAKFHEMYEQDPVAFIQDWCWTYDPRNAERDLPVDMPFILFPRQIEFVHWLWDCVKNEDNGLAEKSRDMGATWVCVAFSVWLWLFRKGASIGWGSRKEMLVDHLGDMDSIFEKVRYTIDRVPFFAKPAKFNKRTHLKFMTCINPDNGSAITGEAGDQIGRGGRAQPLETQIPTPSGWTTMGGLDVGDLVFGADGKPTPVLEVFPQGIEAVYRVSFQDGTSTECSAGHLWRITTPRMRKSRSRERKTRAGNFRKIPDFEIRTLWELLEKGLRVDRDQTEYRYQIPMTLPVQYDDLPLPLDPYVLGSLLGDGTFSQIDTNNIGFATSDQESLDAIQMRLPDGCDIVPDGNPYSYRLRSGTQGKHIECPMKGAIRSLGLSGKTAPDKFIPDAYKKSSVENRLEILRGLMDTDGWLARPTKPCFCSVSKRLISDVSEIVRSLGGTTTMYTNAPNTREFPGGRIYDCRESYNLNISMPTGMNPFKLTRKSSRYKDKKKYPVRRTIVSVEYVGEKETKCIMVGGGLYLTDEFIVTHNSLLYFLDEAAHLERPESIEAALADNTNVQIAISSVNGTANVFYRKRMGGRVNVFVMDWRDHPMKTQEWYDERKTDAEANGLMHVFAQEVDRDYSAAVEGVLIPSKWVHAAIDAHIKLQFEPFGAKEAGLDVADEGGDLNSCAVRHGPVMVDLEKWGEGDTAQTTHKGAEVCARNGCDFMRFDSVGVGAGVKAEAKKLEASLTAVPFSGGAKVTNPDREYVKGKMNKDMFKNLKAQQYWGLRDRFYRTWRMVNGAEDYDHADLISIPFDLPHRHELVNELSQPTRSFDNVGRIVVDKKPDGTKSPNLADSVVIAYSDVREATFRIR